MECLQNSLADCVEVLSAHEERFREEHDLGPVAWSDCAVCGCGCGSGDGDGDGDECVYYFGSVREAGDALSKSLFALQDRHGEERVVEVFDTVAQHRFKDCIDIKVDAEHAKAAADAQTDRGWDVCTLLEQIGPLAEVIPGRPVVSQEDEAMRKAEYRARVKAETGHDPIHRIARAMTDGPSPPPPKEQRRIRLLEPTRLEYYNAEGTMQTTYHEVGEVIEFPTDATTAGTRMVILEHVVGEAPASDINLRRRTVAEVGDIVRVSFHHRSIAVDEHRISKEKLAYLREIGVLETAEQVPQLIANMAVPNSIDGYKVWQRRALDSYAKLELLDVVTEPLPPCVQVTRERLRHEAAPPEAEVVERMQQLHTRGSPRTAALPLVELRNIRRDLRRSYCDSVDRYRILASEDQSLQLYTIDRWIQDYRDRHSSRDGGGGGSGESIPEQHILGHIYQLLTTRYIHGSGKYSDLDQYVIPLKLRMGVSTGVSHKGRFRTGKERREWKSLSIRGEEVTEAAGRKLSKFVRDKYDRLKDTGPWR